MQIYLCYFVNVKILGRFILSKDNKKEKKFEFWKVYAYDPILSFIKYSYLF